MEFWGVEVKAGQAVYVSPEAGRLIHISQVALGDVKNVKSANYVPVRLAIDGKKFVIGTLSAERGPQITFDLVLEQDFELSHDWKDGSIFFCGYTADEQYDEPIGNDFSDDGEDVSGDEELELVNGKPVEAAPPSAKSKAVPAAKSTKPGTSAKPKVTLVDPKKDESDDSDDSEDEGGDESDDDDLEDDSDDDMSEDEETPKKAEPSSKKRPSDSAIKTPASTKKAKTETPQKTDGKKGSVHTATPHPSKKSEKKTAESPKSSAQLSCKTCSKTFNSEKGLESHSKAKHGGK